MIQILFTACCLCAVVGALGAALQRNLFHAALQLGLCLVGTAGLYLFLDQNYLACLQVVVYLGGILVLILFATLFSADVMGRLQRARWWQQVAGLAAAGLAGAIAVALLRTVLAHGRDLRPTVEPGLTHDPLTGPQNLGDLFVGEWLLPFLLAGFLLTVALVVAVATVRRFQKGQEVAHG